ncbi:phosphopyruvate hydratase [Patescibacteria group bacterium]
MKITQIHAREILDSRGNPTIETKVWLEDGSIGQFGVPSGASTGVHEAWELRDGDESRYGGKGVLKPCQNVNMNIANLLQGRDVFDQRGIDQAMIQLDGDQQKKNYGANAILSVSIACAKAAANARRMPLYTYLREFFMSFYSLEGYIIPVPMFNVINGGAHADNNLDVQEFMIGPLGAPTFSEAVRYGAEVFHTLEKILKTKGLSTNVGNEGGFAPNLASNEEAIKVVQDAIKQANYEPRKQIGIGMDVAASEFFDKGNYILHSEGKEQKYTTDAMIKFLGDWINKYELIAVEDGLAEDDWDGWAKLNAQYGSQVQIVGDDFLVTNKERVYKAIQTKACNSVLIKVNQIGSLTETYETIALAYQNGLSSFISHRSGETVDTFIADLSVAVNAPRIKSGAPSRSERVAKYNRLMEIEADLGTNARYAGSSA